MKLSGWGNYPVADAQEFLPRSATEALAFVAAVNGKSTMIPRGTIPRGLGRSYGDSSLAQSVLTTRLLDNFIDFNPATGLLRCAAGVSIASILEQFVPRGWFPYVTPGTKFVTVGGAIASDVHGKNHHIDGCFSDHVEEIKVATPNMGIISCSRQCTPELFHATAGGMGLTGLILEASFYLRPVASAWIQETTVKAANLEQALACFSAFESASYSVA